MDDELTRPYRKLAAVSDLQESNLLLDIYISHYKNKYRGLPVFDVSNSHLTAIKDIKKMGGVKTGVLIAHYFKMDPDGWYSKNAYSLEVLKKNIHVVSASHSQQQHSKELSGYVSVTIHCDACWEPFQHLAPRGHSYDTITRCEPCSEARKPARAVTKKERAQIIFGLSQTFPEMPPVENVEPDLNEVAF